MQVRVRYAPSPTGKLHIGGARTALYNFLFARHEGGKFLLRIEDTDQLRSTREALEDIYESLKWLGIEWDEEPYFQSKRLQRYHQAAKDLLNKGRAYRREDPGKGEAIVFKIERTYIGWDDLIHGKIGRDLSRDPDLVLLKSDGFPTYNFACVVDDIELGITHVIRGDDHIPNTPKQISLYRAFDASPPRFAHVPLILNPDGSKMSKDYKKKGISGKEEFIPTSVLAYREFGFLPEALTNFLALLGWSPGGDREILSMQEMIELFSLERVNDRGAQFNMEKLLWMNGYYIRKKDLQTIYRLSKPFLERSYELSKIPQEKLCEAIRLEHERLKTLAELPGLLKFFFEESIIYEEEALKKILKKNSTLQILEEVKEVIALCKDFEPASLEGILKDFAASKGIKLYEVAQPIRVAITGGMVSPPIHETMALLGKEKVLKRIEDVLKRF
jgi:glutamyl-tRNA synthetase